MSKCVGMMLAEALVRSNGVEVGAIFVENELEMTAANDQHVIETLAPNGAEDAFAVCVGLRREWRSVDHANTCALRDRVEENAELRIIVAEQKLRREIEGREVAQLLREPVLARLLDELDAKRLRSVTLDELLA